MTEWFSNSPDPFQSVIVLPSVLTHTQCGICEDEEEVNVCSTVVSHACDFPGCKDKFKRKYSLDRHMSDKHGIRVVWHKCDVRGCEDKFKQKCHLTVSFTKRGGGGATLFRTTLPFRTDDSVGNAVTPLEIA